MTRKKDLFQLFRDNQHKLNQAPSPRTWQRLEQRLDAYQPKRRFSLFRTLSMAAAVLVLVVLVSLISLLAGGRDNRFLASNGKAAPSALEDLRHTDADPYELQTVKITQQAQQQLRRPISEGDASKKLVVSSQNSNQSSGHAPLNSFNWLLGQWQSNANSKTTVDVWKRLSPRAIEGTSTSEGPQQRVEHLRIFQENGSLYFSTDLGGRETNLYTLLSLTEQEAVFENLSLDFPQQAIFRRDGQEGMAIIYRNQQIGQADAHQQQSVRRLRLSALQ